MSESDIAELEAAARVFMVCIINFIEYWVEDYLD